jgi:Ca2+-binding RTX toxin-like protein
MRLGSNPSRSRWARWLGFVTISFSLSASLMLEPLATFNVAATPGGSHPTCLGRRVTLAGTRAGDVLLGTERNDVIRGFRGGDTIIAGGGNDLICAGRGGDFLLGDGGTDYGRGGPGSDKCISIERRKSCEVSG